MPLVLYYGNALASGVLSGTNDAPANPVRRVADGSINLGYTVTSGDPISGSFEVTLASAVLPQALVMPRCILPSGLTVKLISEDVGGGNQSTVLTSSLASAQVLFVADVPSGTARRVWRVLMSGASGLVDPFVYEAQLATKYTVSRRPEVGVTRSRERQFTRIAIPGGQPFVKRDGPALRGTRYTLPAISGQDVGDLEHFVDAVAGGEAFTITDDRAETYWGELLGASQDFDDQAGVFHVAFAFQEIKVD